MPRPKLDLTEEQRQERLKEQRRKNSLAYYHRNNTSKTPRVVLNNFEEMKEYIENKKGYFRNYYLQHKEELIKKAKEWRINHPIVNKIENDSVI